MTLYRVYDKDGEEKGTVSGINHTDAMRVAREFFGNHHTVVVVSPESIVSVNPRENLKHCKWCGKPCKQDTCALCFLLEHTIRRQPHLIKAIIQGIKKEAP